MMKKMLSLVMAVVMILSLFSGMGVVSFAEDDILSYLTYEIKNGEVIITGSDENIQGNIVLPETIEGYPVTEIGQHAFMQSRISFVEFSDTLKKIGYGAFWNSGLEVVSIPDSVEIIEEDAFGDCFSLKGIYTGRNITEISGQMLRENYALTEVFIGKKVKKIGYWGFNLSDNIENIYYEGTQEEWNQIAVDGTGNDILKTANIIFNCTEDFYSVCKPSRYDAELQMGYSVSLGKVTIEYTSGNIEGDCVIPGKIDGCPVTTIRESAFNFEPDMDSVLIPASVTKIEGTFAMQCFNLENIYVDENNRYFSSVDGNLFNKEKTELLRYAIGNNRKEYTIPDFVTTINEFAFIRKYGTLKLNVPASVTIIEDYVFYNAHHLYYINVDENNPAYLSDDGVLFNKDKTILLCFPALRYGAYHWGDYIEDGIDTTKESYMIPDGVKQIGAAAFNCSEIENVVIPESVEYIGANAFDECRSLECVNIPGSVTSVQECAFRDTAMKELVIPNSVTYIGDGAFQMNSSLKSVTIPDSVNYIGDCAFSSCEKLSDIKMGDSVKNIGIDVFVGTAYYNNPDNWENNALYIGKNLIEVNDKEITEYTVKDGTVNIAGCTFYWCENIRELNLPDSVASISNYAFAGMSSVEKIDIPSGVTEIGDYTFMRCSNLREVNIPASVIKIGDGIFYWSDSIRQINYDGDKAGWNNIEISDVENDWVSYLTINCKKEPVVDEPTTQKPDVQEPTTQEPDVQEPTTQKPDVQEPTTQEPTTQKPVESTPGDLDGNGKITAADARVALRISAKLEKATEAQKLIADVNKDGKITAADARKILRVAAKLEQL